MSRTAGLTAFLVFAGTLLVYSSTAGGSLGTRDAVEMYELTAQLLQGRLGLPPRAGSGPEPVHYLPWGLGQSLYNIPFYLAGTWAERFSGLAIGRPGALPKAAVALGSAVAAAGAAGLTFLFASRLVQSSQAAVLASLLFAFGTMIWPYSKYGFNAALTTVALVSAIYALWTAVRLRRPWRLCAAGCLLGLAVLVRHEMVLAVLPATIWLWMESDGLRTFAARARGFALGAAPPLLVWAWYNIARFGTVWNTGYAPAFSTDGFLGLTLSPAGSIFLYSPVVVIGAIALGSLWRTDRPSAILLGSLVAVFLLFYGSLDDWLGVRSYGPRYLVPLLPFLVIPIAPLLENTSPLARRGLAAAAIVSTLVQVPAVLVDSTKVRVEYARRFGTIELANPYAWQASPLVLCVRSALTAVPANARYVLGRGTPPSIDRTTGAGEFSQQFSFSLDLWWLYITYLGVTPAWLNIMAGLLPGAAGVWLLGRAVEGPAR